MKHKLYKSHKTYNANPIMLSEVLLTEWLLAKLVQEGANHDASINHRYYVKSIVKSINQSIKC